MNLLVETFGAIKRFRAEERQGTMPFVRIDLKLNGKSEMQHSAALNAVDEALKQFLEEAGNRIVHDFLGKNSCLRREISEDPEVFSAGSEKLTSLTTSMMKNLYRKLLWKTAAKENCEHSNRMKESKNLVSRLEGE